MNPYPTLSPFKDFYAWAPIALALVALGMVISHVAVFGMAREADEGAIAHLWQLLMAAQLLLVMVFGAKWLAKRPRAALAVLGLQVLAALGAIAPVALLGL